MQNREKEGERMEGRAWFRRRPGILAELRGPYPLEEERPYRVAAVVTLGDMDFQNFITDLYADRDFLEEHANLCAMGEVWNCLLVRCPGEKTGVLVMPEEGRFVGWAAAIEMDPQEKK